MFISNFACAIAALGSIQITVAQKCTDVYPHLSCGLRNENERSCKSAGCCWDESAGQCFAPAIFGYKYTSTLEEPGRQQGTLRLNEPSGISFGQDYVELDISITQETKDRTHIKISVPGIDTWEIPESLIARPGGLYTGDAAAVATHVVPQDDDDPYDNMEILINRMNGHRPTSELIFVFTKMLVFQEQYLQFVLGSMGDVVGTFGFGESSRLNQRLATNTTYTLWNTDMPAAKFDADLYGSHPFYIQVTESGKAHGVLFMNSNAMDVTLTNSETQGNTIAIQSTGGLVDIYVFAGPTPSDVVKQFLDVVGKPALVPYWSLGFHNCRWGYESVEYIREVVYNYSLAEIPLETQWVDIDYMDDYKDFTLDPRNFGNMQSLVDELHNNNQRFVPIIDPGIFVEDSEYQAYQDGVNQDVFVKDLYGENPYLAQCWPGPQYFPDWFSSNATSYWQTELASFYSLSQFDGIWIDMNEVSNFCNYDGAAQICVEREKAQCLSNVCCLECSTVDKSNKYDFPPFVPHTIMRTLGGRTLPMSALHAGGVPEYNVHNLHGLMESIATRSAVTNILKERPFVLSRSTFLSSGKYTAHWTGDNAATWDDLAVSIVTMNNMALFGIPMIGADICGFQDDTTEELCGRWIQVGAFSPFSRDHNIRKTEPQELYRWESVTEISRTVLGLRYRLLPYLYTLMYEAHDRGRTVHNAMWVHFSGDPVTLFQDKQFMWSNGILFTPVVTESSTSVEGYFPASLWYSLFDESMIDTSTGGQFIALDTPFNSTNAHLRGGTVIPMQEFAMTTKSARETPFSLTIALDENNEATGSLFLDDGVQIDINNFATIEYSVVGNTLKSSVLHNSYPLINSLRTVTILGKLFPAQSGHLVGATCWGNVITKAGKNFSATLVSNILFKNFYRIDIDISSLDVGIVSEFSLSWGC